ncbi:MAG: MaoC family dehydratase [Alphaproteobacteria bacterium]|nr:MaoC family dehydratase [Alphaproteobacteria bacterium]
MTYYVDQLQPGMSEQYTRTVTERDIVMFGEVSGDTNPVHFDAAFAATTPFRTRIAHGMLSASYISTILGMKMPGPGTIFLGFSCRFKAPVRVGDKVVAEVRVRDVLAEKRRVVFDCDCRVVDTVVLEGEAVVMPPPRPRS